MEHHETYMGRKIKIVTGQDSGGTWHATAQFEDGPGHALSSDGHASESESHRAAFSAAMAEVDRSRARIGKP
jgi:hypothetical protein